MTFTISETENIVITDNLTTYITLSTSNGSFSIAPTIIIFPTSNSDDASSTTMIITTGILLLLLIGSGIVFCTGKNADIRFLKMSQAIKMVHII